MSEYKLASEIVLLSNASNWDEAKLEWDLFEIFESTEPETCLCGHYPIIEICDLQNKQNGNFARVGNVCVKKFLGLPSDKIFQAVKRVRKEPALKSLNAEAIEFAHRKKWLNDWERTFYLDNMRKRKLSSKQATKKREINEKIILKIRKAVRTLN